MLSSRLGRLGGMLFIALLPGTAAAARPAQGFDLERLYTSAPGGGWFVMDRLDLEGGLGGAATLTTSYARNALHISDGSQRLDVVSAEAFLQLGLAATYDRFRIYLTLDAPLWLRGNSGTAGGYVFTAPSVDRASSPDAISHGRVGLDARLFGDPRGFLRLGIGVQLWFPGGAPGALRSNYLSDGPPGDAFGAYDAMVRVLVAGDAAALTYAAHAGLHLRALDDPAPQAPRGSEALFGAAAGTTVTVCGACANARLVVGPEVFGATALRSAFSAGATAAEGLLEAQLLLDLSGDAVFRLKLGAGGGLDRSFGAPDWRIVLGLEVSGPLRGRETAGAAEAASSVQ